MHPAFGLQPFGGRRISLRPGAASSARSEALAVCGLVPTPNLAVDPPVAQRLLERLVVSEAGRLFDALLGEHQPDPLRVTVVFAKPGAPGGGVADDQFLHLCRHVAEKVACDPAGQSP